MTKSLIILESPNKIKAYQSFLGKDYKIIASCGHIKDLPAKELGIDIEHGFEPKYIPIAKKAKEIAEIKKCAGDADVVYLATDPDREGEAIAFHIAEIIKSMRSKHPEILRILPQEISKKAILNEIAHPTHIDLNKYDSQQARRVLDRLVGYQISPILWNKVRRGLSAGRVQSVAVRLIVDRENAIQNYKSLEYWKITAALKTPKNAQITLNLVRDGKQTVYSDSQTVEKNYPKGVIASKEQADAIVQRAKNGEFIVSSVEKERRESRANPPFSTADLLRCASSQLGFSSKTTSSIAQKLFESVDTEDGPVGLITYIRTDSVRVSDEAIQACRGFIGAQFGADYLPPKPIHHETIAESASRKKGAVKIQDAHEAIRPTDVNRTPESLKKYLTRDQYKLYDLIWRRFVASQMAPAVSDVTTVLVQNGSLIFRVSGSVPKFPGYKRALQRDDKDENEAAELILPDVREGEKLACNAITPQQLATQPPKRYTEASFIKELKDKGIGRPSTISTIVVNIQQRGYVQKINDTFHPTELGVLITELLVQSFPDILSTDYTKDMEDKLEVIAAGDQSWRQTIADFYGPFSKALEAANATMRNVKRESEQTDVKCDKCGAPMLIKWGKNGHFLACSNYPECKNTCEFTRDENGNIIPHEKTVEYAGTCPECNKPMLVKTGRFGKFLACSGYPECKHTEPLPLNVTCPREGCTGKIVQKRSKRGKIFYGCNRYPDCDFVSWNEPTNEICPNCHDARLEIVRRAKTSSLLCPKCAFSRLLDGDPKNS